jgi:sec-independent protein translocase protein TatB
MFDISWSEFLLIGVVALVVIGPKELPAVMRTLGQWTRKVRGMASEFQNQFQEAIREAEMTDLKKEVDDLAQGVKNFDPLKDIRAGLESTGEDVKRSLSSTPDGDAALSDGSAETALIDSEPELPFAAAEPAAIAASEPLASEPQVLEPQASEPQVPAAPVEPAGAIETAAVADAAKPDMVKAEMAEPDAVTPDMIKPADAAEESGTGRTG